MKINNFQRRDIEKTINVACETLDDTKIWFDVIKDQLEITKTDKEALSNFFTALRIIKQRISFINNDLEFLECAHYQIATKKNSKMVRRRRRKSKRRKARDK